MRRSIRQTLSLSYLAILLAGMGLAAGLAWLAVEGLYLDNQRENLLAQARLNAAALQGADLPQQSEVYSQAQNVAPGIHTRLLSEEGGVIVSLPLPAGEAQVQTPPGENSGFTTPAELLQRPEIQAALGGEAATAVRRVAAAGGRRVLYAAAPVFTLPGQAAGENRVTGIVYLASPLPPGGLPLSVILQLGGALLLAIILSALAGGLLARRIARPVERIAAAAQAVSAGDLAQQVPAESSIDELHRLGNAFNAMTAGLRHAEQTRNAFIADITHELRTPLTVIKGTIETLEDGAIEDLQGRGALLASMYRESERLIRLVNDLLLLTRADAGKLRLQIGPLDLAELVRRRIEHFGGLAAQRGVKIRIESEASNAQAYSVLADADRLAQVIDNLLDNALRYAPAGSAVTVRLERLGNEVGCTVSDCGPGIPAEHLPFIFERFYRAASARDRQSGGAGLGLAIVRALVVALGGRVEARSVEGEGTEIIVWLARERVDR